VILLLGGTSEAGTIAAALAAAGVRVLVSAATELASSIGASPLVAVRSGALDDEGLEALIAETGARAVVDATHPYASAVTQNAQRAAARACVPYLRYLRPASLTAADGGLTAADHEAAAVRAFRSGRPVLLTIGTRNLEPYLREARRTGIPVVARALPAAQSLRACWAAGLTREEVVPGQGPFTVDQNVELIRRCRIGVLVTKDGGAAGGVPEKLEAARREGCEVVVVARPPEPVGAGRVLADVGELVAACVALEAAGAAGAAKPSVRPGSSGSF
jgi:precorrin-6A/cobalt-precorrin-6A reductase